MACVHRFVLTGGLQGEYALLKRLVPLQSPSAIANTFASLTQPLISTFTSVITSIQNLTKRSLRTYLHLAFSTYAELTALQGRWDDILRQPADRKQNDLADSLHSLRAVCLRIFPEVIADIKIATSAATSMAAKPVEVGTGVATITRSVSDTSHAAALDL
jgi:exocyst complex protein 7